MARDDIDLTPPLSREAKQYLTSRGQDWQIAEIEVAYENQRRSMEAAKATEESDGESDVNPEDDYNNWKVPELKAELTNRRHIARGELEGSGADEEQYADVDRRYATEGNKPDLVARLEEDDRRDDAIG